ncbi:DUF2569 domain-containing protein [Paenibacillus chitinolyticus]|uniref:DUF2569 domain-containing protein n=1 Tax=Paenibacillus chitinolyticus TaxID=79263 RepID=UPI00366E36E1
MENDVEVRENSEEAFYYPQQSLFERWFIVIAGFTKIIIDFSLAFYGIYLVYKSFAGGKAWLIEDEFEGKISDGFIAIIVFAVGIWLIDFLLNYLIALAIIPIRLIASLKNKNKANRIIYGKTMYFGFGGWLIVFSIGLIITFIYSIYNLVEVILPLYQSGQVASLTNEYPPVGIAIFIETVTYIFYSVFPLFLGYLCFKQKRLFKTMSITYLTMCIILSVVYYFSSLLISDVAPDIVNQSIVSIIRNVVLFLLWTPYFLKSNRIKNTYIY